MLSLFLVLQAHPADAGTVEAWRRDSFSGDTEMAGTDGWMGGYSQDRWFAQAGWALSDRDDGGGTWGSGQAIDNFLIRGPDVQQQIVVANVRTDDNDTIGLVLSSNGDDTHYVVGWSKDLAPHSSYSQPTVFALRIENGSQTVLAEESGPDIEVGNFWNGSATNTFQVVRNNRVLRLLIDGTEYLSATDPNPLPAGQTGLYAYEAGYDGFNGADEAGFSSIVVSWTDDDDDTVVDDLDNCEAVANTDQVDSNGNGIGDACEGGDADTDTDTDSDTDTDTDTDSDVDLDTAWNDEPVSGARGCGCSKAPGSGMFIPLALALLMFRRLR